MGKRTSHGLPGIYNSSAITLSDGQGAALALDSSGRILTSALLTGDLQLGAVEIKDGTTDARLTVLADNAAGGTPTAAVVGTQYNLTPPTYSTADIAALQSDVNGNLKVTLATQLAGEDLSNNVLKVEQRLSYFAVTAGDAQIKAGAGFLHCVTFSCNDAAPTAGTIILYDALTETGTQIFNHTFTTTPFMPFTVFFDCNFLTGLYAGFTTTADVNVSISYR